MPPEENAAKPADTHDITIKFNPNTHQVGIAFDTDHFKTWDFLLGVLEMARIDAEFKRQAAIAQNLQQAAIMQMQQEQMLAQQGRGIQKILRGK